MKNPKQLMIQLLNETAKKYNSTNRSMGPDSRGVNSCVYENHKGQNCAYGSIMTDKALEFIINNNLNAAEASTAWEELQWLVKQGIQIYKDEYVPLQKQEYIPFIFKLQQLHDKATNWDENGLSIDGKRYYKGVVNFIHETY